MYFSKAMAFAFPTLRKQAYERVITVLVTHHASYFEVYFEPELFFKTIFYDQPLVRGLSLCSVMGFWKIPGIQ